MGGEGSMLHAINTLKNNKNLLGRKGMFKRGRTFLRRNKDSLKAAEGEIDIRNLSEEELLLIKEKVLKERRGYLLKAWSITVFVVLIVWSIGYFISSSYYKEKNKKYVLVLQNRDRENFNKNEEIYKDFMQDGAKWMKQERWKNAIMEYNKAVAIFPNRERSNVLEALAYAKYYNALYPNSDRSKKLLHSFLLEDLSYSD